MAATTWKSRISDILGTTKRRQRAATQRAGQAALLTAKLLVPVRTGFLQSSIHLEQPDADTVVLVVGADYGAYVEFGTTRMAPHPYIAPALDVAANLYQIELRSLFK